MFCPKCGAIMHIRTENGEKRNVCSCGYTSNLVLKDKIHENKEKKIEEKEIEVEDRSENILAVYNHTCPNCGYDKAEVINKGTQIGDEDDLVIIKCGKCGHTDRLEGNRAF